MRLPILLAMIATGAAQPLPADSAGGFAAPQGPTVRMDPYVVVAPKAGRGFWGGLSQSLDRTVGKKFMNLRGGPLLDAILYRVKFLREHPGERAIVIVSSEPVHGRVTSATVVFTESGRLYASSASLGDRRRLPEFTAADIEHPDKIGRELQSIRDFYLGVYDLWNRHHGGDALSQPFTTDGTSNALNLDSLSYQQLLSDSLLPQGGALVQAEQTGDYSILAGAGHEALLTDYGSDAEELLKVAYEVLHEETYLPIARARLALPVATLGASGPPAPRLEDVLVFDWNGEHYLFNPDLGTYGIRIPRDLTTGLPALVVRGGDVLESLYFFATFRALFPSERAVFLPAEDGVHAGVAYTRGGRLRIFSPALGTFEPPAMYGIGDVKQMAELHGALVARELAKGGRAATASVDRLPGDDADLQTRRAYLALTEAGFRCELGRADGRPALKVSWPAGSYTYVASPTSEGS